MRKRKQSKYVGAKFDNGWTCTGINVACCTLSHKTGGPKYWYAFERITSDGACDKWIRVEGSAATKIWRGEVTVEEISERFAAKQEGVHKVNYNFKQAQIGTKGGN